MPAALAGAVVFVALGCGDTHKTASVTPSLQAGQTWTSPTPLPPRLQAKPGGYVKLDGDYDNDDSAHPVKGEGDDRPLLQTYGKRAKAADAKQIATVAKGFYAASAAGDAARACSLMYKDLAHELAEQHGQQVPGGCAAPMRALLQQQHKRLAGEDVSTMVVVSVYTKGNTGLAVLGFKATPESEIVVQREGGSWKVDALFGNYMP